MRRRGSSCMQEDHDQPKTAACLAFLLSESEALAAWTDARLRDAGVPRIRVMTSGIQAARILAGLATDSQGFQPDIIVCGQKMADMDG